jgi:hypothetical protein
VTQVLLLRQMAKPGQTLACLLRCCLHQTRCLLLVCQVYQTASWEQQQVCSNQTTKNQMLLHCCLPQTAAHQMDYWRHQRCC